MILLLGSNGYVGNSLRRLLTADGMSLVDPFCFKELMQPRNIKLLRSSPIIINATGSTHGGSDQLWDTNVKSLMSIYSEIDSSRQRFIHISSIHVSNGSDSSLYVQTKRESEKLLLEYFSKDFDSLSIIRLPTLWSNMAPKQGSLLHDLVQCKKEKVPMKLNYPHKDVQICTDTSMFDTVKSIITNNFSGTHVPAVAWSGPVELLVHKLRRKIAPYSLQRIFDQF